MSSSSPTEILNPVSGILPVFDNSNEATRLSHRYLDLRSSQMQQALRFRNKITSRMRRYLEDYCGFIDIQTPTMAHFTPGGAAEFPVLATKSGECYSLPQSPQIYKQLLMCGAIDRYYQVAICYRDEDIKPDRQPEFTQLDLEMSFTDQHSIMSLIEQIIIHSWPEGLLKPNIPFPRMEFAETMRKFGTDKPDLRVPWEIFDCSSSEIADKPNAKMFIAKKVSQSLTPDNFSLWKERIEKLPNKQEYEILPANSNQLCKFMGSHDSIKNHYNTSQEDAIVICWGEDEQNVRKVLGHLRNYLANATGLRCTQHFEFLWVHRFPLFTRNELNNALESSHHPFTAPISEHIEQLKDGKNLERIEAQHYDLVLNGVEIGGGSIRIHDSELQRHVLEDILQLDSSHLAHFLTALRCGAPPHGGFALGLDRYIAILNAKGDPNASIRSVIAFPKASSGRCLMTNSPEVLSKKQLSRYGLIQSNINKEGPEIIVKK